MKKSPGECPAAGSRFGATAVRRAILTDMGLPIDQREALRMLRRLPTRQHRIHSSDARLRDRNASRFGSMTITDAVRLYLSFAGL
jgi:hypothetical protein